MEWAKTVKFKPLYLKSAEESEIALLLYKAERAKNPNYKGYLTARLRQLGYDFDNKYEYNSSALIAGEREDYQNTFNPED